MAPYAAAAVLLFVFAAVSAGQSQDPPLLRNVSLENPVIDNVPLTKSTGGNYCERILVIGRSRLNIRSYANVRRVVMNVSTTERAHSKVEVCIHSNTSMGLCDCEFGELKIFQSGHLNIAMSPYVNKYLDVRSSQKTASFSLFLNEEFQQWRLICLAFGFLLLLLAPLVSAWAPFYYSSSMALGIVLVVLILLFQGMRLLPLGRKNIIYLAVYSSMVGFGSYMVLSFSTIVSSIMKICGFSEDMYPIVYYSILVTTIFIGAAFGYWAVRKFILSEDGTVDNGIAQFVKWAMRAFASLFILQSTPDALLGVIMLAVCCSISSAMNWTFQYLTSTSMQRTKKSKPINNVLRRQRGNDGIQFSPNSRHAQFLSPPKKSFSTPLGSLSSPGLRARGTNGIGRGQVSPMLPKMVACQGEDDYYSSFCAPPRKFTKRQWEDFTEDETRKALTEHAATPEFVEWVASKANQLHLRPDVASDESSTESSMGSEETTEENGTGRGLLGWFRS